MKKTYTLLFLLLLTLNLFSQNYYNGNKRIKIYRSCDSYISFETSSKTLKNRFSKVHYSKANKFTILDNPKSRYKNLTSDITKLNSNVTSDSLTLKNVSNSINKKEIHPESSLENALRIGSKVFPNKTKYENFEVVYLDFHKDWLQRVFVTIDTAIIYDTLIIQSVIFKIQTLFEVGCKTNISFFSEKKYADYKTTLFMDEEHSLPTEEYGNWMEYYYLAEFEFETNEFKTFPVCMKKVERKKTIKIK